MQLMEPYSVLCHAQADHVFADRLRESLNLVGFQTKNIQDLPGLSKHWSSTVDESIRRASALIVLLSSAALTSEEVSYGWSFALGASIPVIPLLVEPTALPERLHMLDPLDFTTLEPSWEALYERLRQMMQKPRADGDERKTAWLEKGGALMGQCAYKEALEAYTSVFLLDPRDVAALIGRAEALIGLQRYSEALELCEQVLRLYPHEMQAWFSKGNALLSLDRPAEGLMVFEQILRYQPTQAFAWLNKGNALVMLHRHTEALIAYDYGLRYAPDNWIIWQNKGSTYRAMGKKKEAQYHLERAEQLRKE